MISSGSNYASIRLVPHLDIEQCFPLLCEPLSALLWSTWIFWVAVVRKYAAVLEHLNIVLVEFEPGASRLLRVQLNLTVSTTYTPQQHAPSVLDGEVIYLAA